MTNITIESIVKERIEWLFDLAKKNAKKHEDRSKRYVELARKLATRHRARMPKSFKKRFCKVCNRTWITGYNLTVRINKRKKVIEYRCACGSVRSFGYKKTV